MSKSLQELRDIARNKISDALLPYSVDNKTQGELFDNILSIISTMIQQNGGDVFNGYVHTSSEGPSRDITGNLSYISSQTAAGTYVYSQFGNLSVTISADHAPALIFINRVNNVWSSRTIPLNIDLGHLATKKEIEQVEQNAKNELNQKALIIPEESVTKKALAPSVIQMIASGGNVTNMPDDEDLTVDTDRNTLKLKDRVYVAGSHRGRGRKILRENIDSVSGKNILTQAMINEANRLEEHTSELQSLR